MLELPAEAAIGPVDEHAALEGDDGFASPSLGSESPGEVEVQDTTSPAILLDGFLAQTDASLVAPMRERQE
jgi:hypothetical protein